jgi:ABC-2 type transport system ATP-binding protein
MFALECRGLSKWYQSGLLKRVHALEDLNLTVEANEIFGFLGPNGAGKTTTLKIIAGLLKPTSGTASIFEVPVDDIRSRERIGFLPEHPSYYSHLTGAELLDFAGGLFALPAGERKKRTEALLERVGLSDAGNVRVSEYSKGMVQRLGIAQSLISSPDVVMLDEPLSGLDPIGRKELKDIIVSLKGDGKTVFFSTHILADVERICDRVAILHKGKLLRTGHLADLLLGRSRRVTVTVEPAGKSGKPPVEHAVLTAEGYWSVTVEQGKQKETIELLMRDHARIVSVVPEAGTLEDYFVAEIEKDET